MRRHGAAVAVLSAVLATVLAGCGAETGNGADPARPSTPPAATLAPKAVSEEARRETLYLEATAAHLCSVQARVYLDPAEMAAAYASRPRYVELTEEEVAAYDRRRATDEAFATRLAETIMTTCPGPAAS